MRGDVCAPALRVFSQPSVSASYVFAEMVLYWPCFFLFLAVKASCLFFRGYLKLYSTCAGHLYRPCGGEGRVPVYCFSCFPSPYSTGTDLLNRPCGGEGRCPMCVGGFGCDYGHGFLFAWICNLDFMCIVFPLLPLFFMFLACVPQPVLHLVHFHWPTCHLSSHRAAERP